MNPTTTVSQVGPATTAVDYYNDSLFSLLHDDDDEEIVPSVAAGSTSTLKREIHVDTASDTDGNITTTSEEHSYDSILEQTTKWMADLEQIRDTTTWCHVENSFHRDVFAMMDVQTNFNYPSI